MSEKMTKKQFAEYVMTRLPLDHKIHFRGADATDGKGFDIASIYVGDSSCYVANCTAGGHPFCFTYGSQAMFTERAVKALHKYLCDIPSFEKGVVVYTEEEYPTVDDWGTSLFLSRLWYMARWGDNRLTMWNEGKNIVFRIRSPKYGYLIEFRVVPFGPGTIVTATEPLSNKANVQFCCDVTEGTKQEDFFNAVTNYLNLHGFCDDDTDEVVVVRYE